MSPRADVKKKLPQLFDRPTPFTVASVRYAAATADTLTASVYISDDANRGISPRKYLGPEMFGGGRGVKASERLLMDAGVMERAQAIVPSASLTLDRHGNVPGSLMVKVLSRMSSFNEMGFQANASAKLKFRLAKAKRAVASTGPEFFVAHSKRGGEPLGIWRLVGKGRVRPVLVFANKRPSYSVRFPMRDIVAQFATKHFSDEVVRALLEQLERRGHR